MTDALARAPAAAPAPLPDLPERIVRMPYSPIREVSMHPAGRDDVVPLWFGESDVPTDEIVSEAAAAALAAGRTFYTSNRGIDPLREAIVAYGRNVYARPPGIDRLTVAAGGMAALSNSLSVLLDPGDRVLVVDPVWPNIVNAILERRAIPVRIALEPGASGWRLDLDRLLEAMRQERPRAVFVNSPGNPTGWVLPDEGVRRLLDACRAAGVWLISDEVYHRIVFEGDHAPSVLDHAGPEDPVIVINSFSKAWAMTGWRLGWAVHPPSLGPKLDAFNEMTVSGAATSFVQWGGIAALERGEPIIRAQRERCARARDLVIGRLSAMNRVRVVPPGAGFYAFFGVEGVGDSIAFAKTLLEQTGVGLAPGIAFGPAGEGFLRLCFASRLDTLERALDRLTPALA